MADAVDKNHMATLQAVMAATTNGLGNGVGSLLGGIVINKWSPLICYFVFAVASCLFFCLLIVVGCLDQSENSRYLYVSKSSEVDSPDVEK